MSPADIYLILILTILVLLPLAIYGAVCLTGRLRAYFAEGRTDTNLLRHAPDTVPLANATWATHVAVQKLDAAVLMEGPPEIIGALDIAKLEAWKLCDVLDGLKGTSYDHEKR